MLHSETGSFNKGHLNNMLMKNAMGTLQQMQNTEDPS